MRDIRELDALYFTTLNSNKKSLELDPKTSEGKAMMERLIRAAVLVENCAPVRRTQTLVTRPLNYIMSVIL